MFLQMTSMADKCNKCASGFGLLTKKYCCKVCGVVLCKSCIHKELLVYIPDDVNDNIPADVELAIIKIVGVFVICYDKPVAQLI
jgi:hypothetical protein